MTLRPPPSRPFSVSRKLSERARAVRAAAQQEEPSEASGFSIPGLDGVSGMVSALRGLVEQLAATAQQQAGAPPGSGPDSGPESADQNAGTFSFGGGKARMVFGYTLRMGSDGISAEPFGDVPAAATKPRADRPDTMTPAALQPIVEVYQDGDTVVVIAELPGADPDRIVCQADGTRLLIEAAGVRQYRKELMLPVPVRSDGIVRSIQNGILEVRLGRAGTP